LGANELRKREVFRHNLLTDYELGVWRVFPMSTARAAPIGRAARRRRQVCDRAAGQTSCRA
jgi:hypothetical protein